MYQNHGAMVPSSQKPETFLLSPGAESALPQQAQIALQQVDNLKYFLISAPVDWLPDQYIRRFLLPTGEYVSCVLWNNLFHISGTDIVRCLAFRFQAFGRPVKNAKKFEEGIFSDLRNLKSGNDASLEDPKSPFLDFLYKNNCIRTQKKQKVFYWYSVPHDRLFLDALERDLKREKASQEATTTAVSEPALSFEFDSSQSLFEQLTKAQQQSTSSFNGPSQDFSHSASPVEHAEAMPPPQMVSHAAQNVMQETLNDITSYSHTAMPVTSAPMTTKPDRYYGQAQYDRPAGHSSHPQHQHRHSSMPSYMEYSPAPSFVSSQSFYDEYSARGVSYEPITPPQQVVNHTPEPAYVPNDDTGLYPAIQNASQNYQNMMQMPTSSYPSQQYNSNTTYNPVAKSFPSNNIYSHIEGSPTYKQKRRRTSLTSSYAAAITPPPTSSVQRTNHAVRRPSDLRRAVSASVVPMSEQYVERAMSGPPVSYPSLHYNREVNSMSRHGSPLATIEDHQALQQRYREMSNEMHNSAFQHVMSNSGPGVVRRARSATTTEVSPYPQKSHTCPIPACHRHFKRLEHLKRHVRTHTQERPYVCQQCGKAFSRSDNLAQHRRIHDSEDGGQYDGNYSEEELETGDENLSASRTDHADMSEQLYMQSSNNLDSMLGNAGSMGPPPLPHSIVAQGY